jgi:hypothetical protein
MGTVAEREARDAKKEKGTHSVISLAEKIRRKKAANKAMLDSI